jgi:hypothetical protein
LNFRWNYSPLKKDRLVAGRSLFLMELCSQSAAPIRLSFLPQLCAMIGRGTLIGFPITCDHGDSFC